MCAAERILSFGLIILDICDGVNRTQPHHSGIFQFPVLGQRSDIYKEADSFGIARRKTPESLAHKMANCLGLSAVHGILVSPGNDKTLPIARDGRQCGRMYAAAIERNSRQRPLNLINLCKYPKFVCFSYG